jgi:hypothetical protein
VNCGGSTLTAPGNGVRILHFAYAKCKFQCRQDVSGPRMKPGASAGGNWIAAAAAAKISVLIPDVKFYQAAGKKGSQYKEAFEV